MTYPELDRAIRYAAEAHAGTEGEGEHPLPYITHPMEVLIVLRQVGAVTDEALLVAAVLHDTLEETETTEADLRRHFGDRVTALVKELTRTEPDDADREGLDKDAVWSLRSGLLMSDIAGMSAQARTIKLADRICNLRDARVLKTGRKLDRYLRQTTRILDIIPRATNPALWDDLAMNAGR